MDPNPFKHPAVMLAKIRDAIAPNLAAAGFVLEGRNKPERPVHLYIDYSRGNELFRLSFDRRESERFIGFIAEFMLEPDRLETLTSSDLSSIGKLPRNTIAIELEQELEKFADSINQCLRGLESPSHG